MDLLWTLESIEDRESIYDHIEADNPFAALAVTFHHIESNPFSAFRSHPVFGIWEPVRFRHLQAS